VLPEEVVAGFGWVEIEISARVRETGTPNIGAGRCLRDLPTLYQRTHLVLIAHHERPIYEFHW
jgi:hypothetical protein